MGEQGGPLAAELLQRVLDVPRRQAPPVHPAHKPLQHFRPPLQCPPPRALAHRSQAPNTRDVDLQAAFGTVQAAGLVAVARALLAGFPPGITSPAAQDVRGLCLQKLLNQLPSTQPNQGAGQLLGLCPVFCFPRQLVSQLLQQFPPWYPCHRSGPPRCVPSWGVDLPPMVDQTAYFLQTDRQTVV